MRQCSKCKRWLEKHNFSKNKTTRDGYSWWCKECMTTKQKEYRDKRKLIRLQYDDLRKIAREKRERKENSELRKLNVRKRTKLLGSLGELYVMFKLAQKGIRSQKMEGFIGYDILTWDGIRIEVKTSPLKKTYQKKHKATQECWQFANHKAKVEWKNGVKKTIFIKTDRNCDFFIFVCLDKNFNVAKTFIVPKEVIETRRTISIPKEFKKIKIKFSLKKYEDEWNLIKV